MSLPRIVPLLLLLVVAAVGVPAAATAPADSTPIGPLPNGPVTDVQTARGSLVAVALLRQNPTTGLVWRTARPVDTRVVKQLSEADVSTSVVLVFRTVGKGEAALRFALTRGESSGKALRSATYRVHVR